MPHTGMPLSQLSATPLPRPKRHRPSELGVQDWFLTSERAPNHSYARRKASPLPAAPATFKKVPCNNALSSPRTRNRCRNTCNRKERKPFDSPFSDVDGFCGFEFHVGIKKPKTSIDAGFVVVFYQKPALELVFELHVSRNASFGSTLAPGGASFCIFAQANSQKCDF